MADSLVNAIGFKDGKPILLKEQVAFSNARDACLAYAQANKPEGANIFCDGDTYYYTFYKLNDETLIAALDNGFLGSVLAIKDSTFNLRLA